MVDTRHLKCLAERHTGSTPVLGTKHAQVMKLVDNYDLES